MRRDPHAHGTERPAFSRDPERPVARAGRAWLPAPLRTPPARTHRSTRTLDIPGLGAACGSGRHGGAWPPWQSDLRSLRCAAREAAFIHCAPTFPRRAPLCNTHVPTAAPTASAWPPDPATPAQALPRLGGRGLVSQCPAQAAADLWSPSFSSRPVSWGPLPTGTVVSKSPSDPGHQTGADPDISASNGQWTQCWLPSSTSRTVATRTGLAAFPGGMGPAPS